MFTFNLVQRVDEFQEFTDSYKILCLGEQSGSLGANQTETEEVKVACGRRKGQEIHNRSNQRKVKTLARRGKKSYEKRVNFIIEVFLRKVLVGQMSPEWVYERSTSRDMEIVNNGGL